MKRFLAVAAFGVLATAGALASPAMAQYHDHDRGGYDHGGYDHGDRRDDHRGYDRGYRGHDRGYGRGWHDRSDWRRGGYVARGEWDRGYAVDYRRYHLRQPPYGYEWRRVGDNYVLAAVASGLIADLIINGR